MGFLFSLNFYFYKICYIKTQLKIKIIIKFSLKLKNNVILQGKLVIINIKTQDRLNGLKITEKQED